MRRFLLFCCLALTAVVARAEVIDIDNAELAQLMKSGVTVIDIRTQPNGTKPAFWRQQAADLLRRARSRRSGGWLEKLKPMVKPGDPVVVICRSGNRTKPVSQLLRAAGRLCQGL